MVCTFNYYYYKEYYFKAISLSKLLFYSLFYTDPVKFAEVGKVYLSPLQVIWFFIFGIPFEW